MPFEIVRNDIVNMQVDAALTAEYIKKLDLSCFWQDKKSVALLSVMHLLHQDSIWRLSMLSIL